ERHHISWPTFRGDSTKSGENAFTTRCLFGRLFVICHSLWVLPASPLSLPPPWWQKKESVVGGAAEMHNTSPPAYVPISAYPDPAPVPPSRPSVSEARPSPAPAPPNASSPAAGAADLVSSFKEHGRALISAQRPWLQLLDVTALARPASAGDACFRLRHNIAYFRTNYTLFCLSVLAVSLLWHPASLFAFIALTAAWFFLCFTRDRPVVLCGRPITDGTILGVLSVATIFALIFSNVGPTVFGAIMIGTVIICLHSLFRATTDDRFLHETEAASGGLVVPAYGIALFS
ncbi:unnamed protein product, partial [Musa acuminata subsp. burmannicoides]